MNRTLAAQLEWLSDRGMGSATRDMIVQADAEGNAKLDLALRSMDITNTRGFDCDREVWHLDRVQRRIARAINAMGRGWDFTR